MIRIFQLFRHNTHKIIRYIKNMLENNERVYRPNRYTLKITLNDLKYDKQ